MKKKSFMKRMRVVFVSLLVAVILLGTIAAPQTQVSGYQASYIKQLSNDIVTNYKDYLDSSAMFVLPESIKDEDEISVIVTVDVVSLMDAYDATDKTMSLKEFAASSEESANIKAQIAEEKARFLAALDEKKIAYTVGEDYDTLISGFELLIKAADFEDTCKSLKDGEDIIVGEVYNKCETMLVENKVNVFDTGIFNSGGCGYDGSGMVVAVLDTGLDSAHSAFSVENFTSSKLGLTYDEVAAVLGDTAAKEMNSGITVDDVYINEKVPFGYDYADNDPDVYSTHNNHGTHVSGVIVGKDDTITGVAPNAQLVSMKIFSDVMDTARTAWILAALEDCAVLGVDVINMSLGTSCGFSRESDEEKVNGVYDTLREAGISVVVAASNSFSSAYGSEANGNLGLTSNPDTGTVGSPGTYDGVLSVGSISGVETPYLKYGDTIMYFDEANNNAGIQQNFFETLLGDAESKDFTFVVIPGVGRSADYTGLDVTGKIALVRRGDNTFEEKALIAESKGAAGIIIYNNVSGEIKMNVGEAKLAMCSISQDDGEVLASSGGGTLTISKTQTSGPFISDFSSWGPTPSLNIKPEITAHGGNILSAITGGGYDRLSGTSMACPNLAGFVILLRQYVVENFPDIANDNVKVNEMVNRLMMSTADIALNTNGLPYAVRKQGAGLANIFSSLHTTACIITYDEDGNAMDTSKLELGDDPSKKGVYTMSFAVKNFGSTSLSYDIGAYVMTEGVSDTKTSAGETTVTEQGYILSGASISISNVSGGTLSDKNLTVSAGQTANVTVTITLSDADKTYLDDSFENGMYVEGYITLTATAGTEVNMNVPYLAFYGDWNVAPILDLDYFATDADERDDAIPMEDKTLADAFATRPVGQVQGDYVSYLGSYYFLQDPSDIDISANRDHISLSNQEGTIHSLYAVWAGLLRNAAKVDITITNDATGEVVFQKTEDDVRKSYGDGGTIRPSNIKIDFDMMDYELPNNTELTVRITTFTDYGDGGVDVNKSNVFEFPLTVDFQAPTVTDVEYYYEYDKTLKKNRLYAKVGVYDNHHAMSAQLGYVTKELDDDGNQTIAMKNFEQYLTPVYSDRDSTTYLTYELTDYIYEMKENAMNGNCFAIACYDYALNMATYEIGLPDNFVDFYFDGLEEGLALSPNEVYSLAPLVYPDTEWGELLEYTSSRPSVARIVNDKIVAVSSGVANIKVRDPETNKSIVFTVTVLAEGDEGYRRYDKPVADVFELVGYDTLKAFYILDSNEKDLGDTGQTRFFEGKFGLSMYPSETVLLNYDLDAFFPNDTTVVFETSNENIVKITEGGVVTAVAEGFASVTIRVMQDDRSTYYSETVSVEVKDPFLTTGATLSNYYGNGGVVMVPEDLQLTEIGAFAFSNYDYVDKTEEELAFDDAETMKQWYIGESTITKVILPEGIKKINPYAFANLTALEEIVLPSTLEAIEYGAFYGCSSLEKITFSGENNLKIINQNAFESCNLQGTIDLSAVCVISDHAFAGNQELKGVITSDSLLSIGQYAFAGCKKLTDVTITASKVKYGAYAFTDCESLTTFYVNAAVLPKAMFYECKNLTSVTIGPDVNEIGESAFLDSAVATFEIDPGNTTYKVQNGNYILSADGLTLVAVAPTVVGEFTADNIGGAAVTTIGDCAFSHNEKITSVVLPQVTYVGDYGFSACEDLVSVTLGNVTHFGEYAFFGTAITELPAFTAETEIGRYAFSHTAITSVTIPDGMVIAEGVFSNCMNLETVVIGNDVTIGMYAFTMDKDNIFTVEHYDEDDERYFYYEFSSPLVSLTIGDNAIIGENAFSNAASLESVTLGANAEIGYMAFYNNCSLKEIDLSQAKSIGDYAFSGDVYYICLDDSMSIAAVSKEGKYIYTYHAPALERVDLSAAESVGEYAFTYCRDLTEVVLGENITEIPQYCFSGCLALERINLDKVLTIGDYAFLEDGALTAVDLSSAETVGEYAFLYATALNSLKLNPNGTNLLEGAFSYCEALAAVENLNVSKSIGAYAFAYSAITEADLSAAEEVGDFAFLKEELTPFTVKLGNALVSLGDNPFAMCIIEPFSTEVVTTFNGVDYVQEVYTYDISDSVFVIDGSLYCKVENGLELITYAGINNADVVVADDTVRITSMAFAGSDAVLVKLPYTVAAIGHKAFFACDSLKVISFASYEAPTLEETFDAAYYESFEHIPGTGNFGDYIDYDGSEFTVHGMGLIPYYMWNATDGQYSNVFYGANFLDYIGYVESKLTMIRPVNGQDYETYIYGQYFDLHVDGAAGADDTTLAAIDAIDQIPERVTYDHKDIVEAARTAYDKIATTVQKSLVHNYDKLVSAEQRITQLTPSEEKVTPPAPVEPTAVASKTWLAWVVIGVCAVGVAVVLLIERKRSSDAKRAEAAEDAEDEDPVEEEPLFEDVEEVPEETED